MWLCSFSVWMHTFMKAVTKSRNTTRLQLATRTCCAKHPSVSYDLRVKHISKNICGPLKPFLFFGATLGRVEARSSKHSVLSNVEKPKKGWKSPTWTKSACCFNQWCWHTEWYTELWANSGLARCGLSLFVSLSFIHTQTQTHTRTHARADR